MSATNSKSSRIVVYIKMPGPKLAGVEAFRFPELVIAPIESALALAQLLAPSEPAPEIQELAYQAAVVTGQLVERVTVKNPDADMDVVSLASLSACQRLHRGSAIAAFAHEDWCLISLDVTNLSDAGTILFVELERLGLLRFSEIAAFDPLADSFRTVFPLDCKEPFERHWLVFRSVCAASMERTLQAVGKLKEGNL